MNPIKIFPLIIIACFVSLVAADAVAYQVKIDEPEFIQYVEEPNNKALQVSVVRYEPRKGGGRYVDLVGAVHVGDKQYYQDLNELFKTYDAVLYELVAPEGTSIPKGGVQNKDVGMISSIQMTMKDVLGLSFQMEEVDYTPEHFVHADFSPTEFKASMDAKGESVFSMIFKVWRASFAQQMTGQTSSNFDLMMAMVSSDRQNALKALLAKELANSDGVMQALEGAEGSSIIAERNKKALQVLTQQMKNDQLKSFAIFYGAAHLNDFHKRLMSDFDMVPVSTRWLDAWKLK